MDFRFETELPIRYRDLDTLKHVNNAIYGTYLEEARFRYFERVLGVSIDDRSIVLANLNVDFRRPITLPDGAVRIACGVTEIGESSFRIGYRVYPGGDDEPAATAETVLVAVDGDDTRAVPQAWRERFAEFEPEL